MTDFVNVYRKKTTLVQFIIHFLQKKRKKKNNNVVMCESFEPTPVILYSVTGFVYFMLCLDTLLAFLTPALF